MQTARKKSLFKILWVLCLSIALLLSLTNKLHMHLEHHDHTMSSGHAVESHLVEVHPESTLHDFELTGHHNSQVNHSAIAIDMSADKFFQKSNILDSLIFIMLFVVFFIFAPRFTRITRQVFCHAPFKSCYYSFQPPLRAPPIN